MNNNSRIKEMSKTAIDLYHELHKDAIDCTTIPMFKEYMNMTSNHAERMIIGLLQKNTLYKNEDRLMIRLQDKLCHIVINRNKDVVNVGAFQGTPTVEDTPETVRIILPFSPKWVFPNVKCNQIRRISDYFFFHGLINRITK